MYKVSDSYQRFDQKNNMMMRPVWDPDVKHIIPTNMETRLRHIERGEDNTTGFGLKEFALALSSGLLSSSLGTDINQPNCGLTSWETIPINPFLRLPEHEPASVEPQLMTSRIKSAARHLGADLVGVAKLDMRRVNSHHYITKTRESMTL